MIRITSKKFKYCNLRKLTFSFYITESSSELVIKIKKNSLKTYTNDVSILNFMKTTYKRW